MTTGKQRYSSYLLRLWRVEEGGWRLMVEEVQTGRRQGFYDLGEFLEFLEVEMEDRDLFSLEEEAPG